MGATDPLIAAEQLLQAGQLEEARRLLKRLHKANPKHPGILLRLAIAERRLEHWAEAIQLLKKALAIAPGDLRLTEELAQALMYSNEGHHTVQAIERFAEVLAARPDYYAVAVNLLVLSLRNDLPLPVLQHIAPLLTRALSAAERLHYASSCAIASYLTADTSSCARFIAGSLTVRGAAADAEGKRVGDLPFMLLYVEFLQALLAFREMHPQLYPQEKPAALLHVIGESHCLTPAQMTLRCKGQSWQATPHLLMGAMAYFFTLGEANAWQYALKETIRTLPKDAPLLVGFGELDCRPKGGIMARYRSGADTDITRAIEVLCARYVRFVKMAQLHRLAPTCIAGVPAPHRAAMSDLSEEEQPLFTGMIRQFNDALAREAATQQLGFVDFYAHTIGEDGWAKDDAHIDNVHLTPLVAATAIEAGFER